MVEGGLGGVRSSLRLRFGRGVVSEGGAGFLVGVRTGLGASAGRDRASLDDESRAARGTCVATVRIEAGGAELCERADLAGGGGKARETRVATVRAEADGVVKERVVLTERMDLASEAEAAAPARSRTPNDDKAAHRSNEKA